MQSARIHPVAKGLADSCNRLHQLGFTPGFSGQCSIWDEDLLWITPAGISFRDLQPEHLLILCPDGHLIGQETSEIASQLALHQAIYQARPQAKALLIANSPHLGKLAFTYAQQQNDHAIQVGPMHTIQLIPPQSGEARLEIAETLFQTQSVLLEVGFGVFITGISLTDAWNQLEHLEAAAAMSHAI
jgi:ribulose-5-phosphate 4-epimerase/fuculose-1-phosphate aldolase